MCKNKTLLYKVITPLFFYLSPLFCFGQIAEITSITQWCDRVGGSISVNILDGIPDNYSYYWSHSSTQALTITDLSPGIYYFYIEDRKTGCSQTLEAEILDFSSCTTTLDVLWNTDNCTVDLQVNFFNFYGQELSNSEFVQVEWNIQNLSGSNVSVSMQPGQNVLEICYDYQVQGSGAFGDQICCSGRKCNRLTYPSGNFFCGISTFPCGLKLNEIHSKPGASFIELIVTGDEESCEKGCDLTNVIIDDNNGDIFKKIYREVAYTENIDDGYIKFNNNPSWTSVPPGSLIVLYEDSKDDNFVDDPADINQDQVYSMWIQNDEFLSGFTRSSGNATPQYQYNGFPTNPIWKFINLDLGYDGLQIRNPEKNKEHAIAIGQSDMATIRSSGTVPIYTDQNTGPDLSIYLKGDAYNESSGYISSSGINGVVTPGSPNTLDNENFINSLRNLCGQESNQVAKINPESFVQNISFDVFPNPTDGSGILNINSHTSNTYFLVIRSVSGQEIYREKITSKEPNSSFALPGKFKQFPPGLYFVDLILDGQSIGVKKLVLTK